MKQGTLALLATVTFACALSLIAVRPEAAHAGCITTLPVSVSFPSQYAGSFSSRLPVTVTTNGPPIFNLTAAIYTFGSDRIAFGKASGTIFSSGTVRMKLVAPMQPGKYTLVLYGEPNANPSCGDRKS